MLFFFLYIKLIKMTTKILEVKKPKHDSKVELPEALVGLNPEKGFLLCFCSPSRSGKSNLIMNLLFNNFNQKGKPYWRRIIWVSPSCMHDETLTGLREIDDEDYEINLICDVSNMEGVIQGIEDSLKESMNEDKEEGIKTILILDDCVGLMKNVRKLEQLCSRYRHLNGMSMIITSQIFRGIPVMPRGNATGWVLHLTHNQADRKKMEEELSGKFKNFNEYYEEATLKPYNFLFCDMERSRLYKNFDELLWSKDEYLKMLNNNKNETDKPSTLDKGTKRR